MQSKIFAIKEIKFAKKDIKSIFALKCSFFSDIIKIMIRRWQNGSYLYEVVKITFGQKIETN